MTGGEGSVRSSDERERRDDEPDQRTEQTSKRPEETGQHPEETGQQEAAPEDDSLGWRGWVVVAALVVSFIVVPWVIILLPEAQGVLEAIGLGWRDAYLVLPLLPALGLATLAVWAAVASRQ